VTLANTRALLYLLQQGDLDAAIDAGLMDWTAHPDDGLEKGEYALLLQTRDRLHTAWSARARFRARQARLERREHERRERRTVQAAHPPAPSATPSPPVLPAAAAAILARARARAGIAPK